MCSKKFHSVIIIFYVSNCLIAEQIRPKIGYFLSKDQEHNWDATTNPETNTIKLIAKTGMKYNVDVYCTASDPIQFDISGVASTSGNVTFYPFTNHDLPEILTFHNYTIVANLEYNAEENLEYGVLIKAECQQKANNAGTTDHIEIMIKSSGILLNSNTMQELSIDAATFSFKYIPCSSKASLENEYKLYQQELLENENDIPSIYIGKKPKKLSLAHTLFNGTYKCRPKKLISAFVTTTNTHAVVTCSFQNNLTKMEGFICNNKTQCDFREKCLNKPNKCGISRNEIIFANETKPCSDASENNQKFCLYYPFTYNNIENLIGHCMAGKFKASWQVFWSLDLNPYSVDEIPPNNEIIRIIQKNSNLTQFECQASSYLFNDNLYFNLELENEKRTILAHSGSKCNASLSLDDPIIIITNKTKKFTFFTNLVISPDYDVFRINCYAQFMNSIKTMSSSYITIKERPKPTTLSEEEEDTAEKPVENLKPQIVHHKIYEEVIVDDQFEEMLYTTQKYQRLSCFGRGEPPLEFIWKYNGQTIVDNPPNLNVTSGNDSSYLEFPEIGLDDKHLYEGSYHCVVRNKNGEAKKEFKVSVYEPPSDPIGSVCIANLFNWTENVDSAHTIEIRSLCGPKITKTTEGNTIEQTFFTNIEHQRLTCLATGQPQPRYNWNFSDKSALKVLPNLTTSTSSNFEGCLEFPKIGEDRKETYEGTYKCIAINKFGIAEKLFSVNVKDSPVDIVIILAITVPLVALIIILIIVLVVVRRYKKEMTRELTDEEIDEFFKGRPELFSKDSGACSDGIDFLPYDNEYEIPRQDLEFEFKDENLLGTGAYSYVICGKIKSQEKPVALKISKPSADLVLFKSLLSEIKIMTYIGAHENVMSLVGVCTESIRNRSIYIATDICELGSLEGYLRKSTSTFVDLINETIDQIDASLLPETLPNAERVTSLDLVRFCAQIAKGMEFLSMKKVIHADLATRNVLLTSQRIAKISDFGLSRKLYESSNYVKQTKAMLPWRWMALESLKTFTFSTSSDVWAFGVTLWEIYNLGDVPFTQENWSNDFVSRLENGMRLEKPKYSTQEIYIKMGECWFNDPERRPDFTNLSIFFQNMYATYGRGLADGNYIDNIDPIYME